MPEKRPFPPLENVAGAHINHSSKRIIFVTKDILFNQFNRDCPKIAASFDEIAGNDLKQVSEIVGLVMSLVAPQMLESGPDDQSRRATCARLTNTAVISFIGCIHLARSGFRLQYMTLSRSVIEAISTVLHLMVEPEAIRAFHKGKLKSTYSVSRANRILPGFAQIWGHLSNQFVHINTMHVSLNPLVQYKKDDDDLTVIRTNTRMVAWLLLVTAELVFIEDIQQPIYWKVVGHKDEGIEISFSPSNEVISWQNEFLGTEWQADFPAPTQSKSDTQD